MKTEKTTITVEVRTMDAPEGEFVKVPVKQHYEGCYRVAMESGFAQIKKNGAHWHAELRNDDGSLSRYAGIWRTLKKAVAECVELHIQHYNSQPTDGVWAFSDSLVS